MRQRVNELIHRVGASLMLRSAGQARLAWVVAITGPLLVAAALAPFRPSIGLAGFLFGTLLFVVAAAIHASIGVRNVVTEWSALQGRGAGWFAVAFGVLLLMLGLRAVAAVVLA